MGVSASYQRKVDGLHEAGLMAEDYQEFTNDELAQSRALIQRLVEHIDVSDKPRIRAILEHHRGR